MPKRRVYTGRKTYTNNYVKNNFSCETCRLSFPHETGIKLHHKVFHKEEKYDIIENHKIFCSRCKKLKKNCKCLI